MKLQYSTNLPEVDAVIQNLVDKISHALEDNVVGIYLFGSLSYGAFNPDTSDIDLMIVLKNPATESELQFIKVLHEQFSAQYPQWTQRVECSYTPLEMLNSIQPPLKPRPYYGEGTFYPEAPYGNEWLINVYLLQKKSLALVGPAFSTLSAPVEISALKEANRRDLIKEWQPKLGNPEWLDNSHYQAYLVLNLCRILYLDKVGEPGSKIVSTSWVKQTYPEWGELIDAALAWKSGQEMTHKEQALSFLKFVLEQVNS